MPEAAAAPLSAEAPPPELVILDWKDIVAEETSEVLLASLETALGSDGIGLVAIRNVPDFLECKQAFLPLAHSLVNLPNDYLEQELTDQASLYNAGWSHGKEKLGNDKKPDLAKGSFYFNPLTDEPGTEQDRAKYPLSYPKNIWPDNEKIPHFRERACRLGQILKQAVTELAKHIDTLASHKAPAYPSQFLFRSMKNTEKAKARLLYYFPLQRNETQPATEDSWIGWHNDSGFLTALAGDMYVDHTTGQPVKNLDPNAGLYVVDRNDVCQRIDLPDDCLAVQMGECTQIVTGGAVAATPHCVRGATTGAPNVARISMACFVDTPPEFPLNAPSGSSRQSVLDAGLQSQRVPPLGERWTGDGMTFGDFLQTTFSLYYSWDKKS